MDQRPPAAKVSAAIAIRETARAKVNLTLKVLGRRSDGYHELESLVTFAGVADALVLHPGDAAGVTVLGPFASDIVGANLLDKTLTLLREADQSLRLGSVELVKNLPVAAGLGGGSADAAALLRALRKANPERAAGMAWQELAARLGADVPVCLAGKPALMWGIGERIEALNGALPPIPAVLVNPRVPLATAAVFQALAAGPAAPRSAPPSPPGPFADLAALLEFARRRGNDLEAPATRLLPMIVDIKSALAAQPGCRLAALSGSGPTCFGIFASDAAAAQAATIIASGHPGWWVVPTRLDGGASRP